MRALLAAAVLLAGCAAAPSEGDIVAASGLRVVDVGISTYEPSIGIDSAGRLFVNGRTEQAGGRPAPGVWRSEDDGTTWTQVVDDDDRPPSSSDPWLWVDPATDRVLSVDLTTPACSWLVWSDDGGESWDKVVDAGCGTPGHHFQKLTGGPPPEGVHTRGYASVLYYSTSSLRDPDPRAPTDLIVGGTGSDVSVSLDGGLTWSASVRVHPPTPGGYSQAGPIAVGPDGTAWSPAQTEGGARIARSRDAGATWELVATLDEVGYQPYGSDPSLTVDAEGTLYLLHPSRESLPVLRASRDGGETWTTPLSLAAENVTSTIFPLVRAMEDGTLAVAYLATTANASAWNGDPSFAPPDVEWRLHLARITEARSTDPRIETVVVEEDPVQRGCIWMRGGIGSSCRNLGDFLGLAARDGLVAAAFVDGCVACPAGPQSTGDAARVALWGP